MLQHAKLHIICGKSTVLENIKTCHDLVKEPRKAHTILPINVELNYCFGCVI